MKTYRLTPEAIEQTMRQEKTRRILGVLATAAGAMLLLYRGPSWGAGLYAPVLIAFAVGGIAVVRDLKKKRVALETYTLTLSHSFVRRARGDSPPLEIRREEVRRVTERPGAGLRVHTESRFRYLDIPAGLEGYDEVSAELRAWAPPPFEG